jgi:hypothetical protein
MDLDLENRVKQESEKLDAQVRELMQWHFSEETGAPFWLDFTKKLDFDPRRDIRVAAGWAGAPLGTEGL